MRSKWEYIRDACRELGYEEAAGIADEIETVLKEIYGDTKTCKWMRDYIKVKEESLSAGSIYLLSGSVEYCIACMEENVDCHHCKFKERTRSAFGEYNVINRFINVIIREGRL